MRGGWRAGGVGVGGSRRGRFPNRPKRENFKFKRSPSPETELMGRKIPSGGGEVRRDFGRKGPAAVVSLARSERGVPGRVPWVRGGRGARRGRGSSCTFAPCSLGFSDGAGASVCVRRKASPRDWFCLPSVKSTGAPRSIEIGTR